MEGKAERFLVYLDPAGVGGYRRRLEAVAAVGYEGLRFAGAPQPAREEA